MGALPSTIFFHTRKGYFRLKRHHPNTHATPMAAASPTYSELPYVSPYDGREGYDEYDEYDE